MLVIRDLTMHETYTFHRDDAGYVAARGLIITLRESHHSFDDYNTGSLEDIFKYFGCRF